MDLLDLLNVGEELADVFGLNGQVTVVSEHVCLSQSLLGKSSLLLFVLLASYFLLQGLIQVSDDGLDFVTEKELFALIKLELDSEHLAKVSQQGCLVGNALEAAELFLLAWKLEAKLDLSDLFHLFVKLTRSDTE